MIQMRTLLKVADNSGAKMIMAITKLGGSTAGRYAHVGDIITAQARQIAELKLELRELRKKR